MGFPKHLRVVVAAKTVQVEINSTTSVPRVTFDPMFVKLTDAIAKALGFSYELLLPRDGEIGRRLSNGTWTGIVGMVQRNEADLGISELSITLERSEAVDFSYPFQRSIITFATRKPEYVSELTTFLGPFSLYVWLLVAACLIILPLVMSVLFRQKYSLRKLNWAIYGIFTRKTLSIRPKKPRDYVMLTSWMVSIAFLSYCYTAVLLSFLTFPVLKGVRTIPELAEAVARGDYECTSYRGTFIVNLLAVSSNPDIRTIGHSLQQNEGSNDIADVLSSTKSSKRPVFIGGENHFRPLKPRYFVSTDEFIPILLGIGMQKDFCCKSQIDRVVGRIWSSGIYSKLSTDRGYMTNSRLLLKSEYIDTTYKIRQLAYHDFEGAFILLIVGYILAICIFMLEVTYNSVQLPKKVGNK